MAAPVQHPDDVSVVVSVFNEERVVSSVVDDVLAAFPNVVCVDDGSSDASMAELRFKGADQRLTEIARTKSLREAEVANPERLGTDRRSSASAGTAPREHAERDWPCS
jgi:hypothetical protein